jgi:hypothetical protein
VYLQYEFLYLILTRPKFVVCNRLLKRGSAEEIWLIWVKTRRASALDVDKREDGAAPYSRKFC